MLWGNVDSASGNQKPVFANTSNVTSASTIHGSAANTLTYYGNVYGVSVGEIQQLQTINSSPKPAHAGWVSQKIGTGPIRDVSIVSGGSGINAAGFIIVTDPRGGTGANIAYTIANSQNTLQASSANAQLNAIASITVVNGGSGFSNTNGMTATISGSSISAPSFSFQLGGRAGRITYETLVAMGSITGDDPKDNVYFGGV